MPFADARSARARPWPWGRARRRARQRVMSPRRTARSKSVAAMTSRKPAPSASVGRDRPGTAAPRRSRHPDQYERDQHERGGAGREHRPQPGIRRRLHVEHQRCAEARARTERPRDSRRRRHSPRFVGVPRRAARDQCAGCDCEHDSDHDHSPMVVRRSRRPTSPARSRRRPRRAERPRSSGRRPALGRGDRSPRC